MRLTHPLAAGVIDAGLSSLGTFALGLYAARVLEPAVLGAYALFFTASMMVGVVPSNLVLLPAEVSALQHDHRERLGLLRQSLKLSSPFVIGAALLAALTVAILPGDLPGGVVLPLASTAVATALFSPIQDHVRRTLHLAGESWAAATVSLVQFAGAIAFLILFAALGVAPAWIPLGALAGANAVSAGSGLAMAFRRAAGMYSQRLSTGELVRSGRWLLASGLIPTGSDFTSSAVIAHLAGSGALGLAEAARVVARPVLVLALGLGAVLNPSSMEAGRGRRRNEARRISRRFNSWMVAGSLAYLGWVSLPWAGNPFAALIPKAYDLPGLVALTLLAHLATGMLRPFNSELIGGGKEAALARVSVVSSALRISASTAAGVLGAFAKPLSSLVMTGLSWLGYGWALRSLYRSQFSADAHEATRGAAKDARRPSSGA